MNFLLPKSACEVVWNSSFKSCISIGISKMAFLFCLYYSIEVSLSSFYLADSLSYNSGVLFIYRW